MNQLSASINPVSIIVVNFNAGRLLQDCISKCLEQAEQVILVDNNSSDNSVEAIRTCFANESRLNIISNDKNLGFAAGCNIGTEAASNEYCLYLNPDSKLQKNAVENLVSEFQICPLVGMTGGFLTNADGTEQGGGRRAIPTPWRSFVRAFGLTRFSNRWPRLFFDFHLHKQTHPDNPIEVEAISGACMMVKRETIIELGGWDDEYFLHCEDLDLCMRYRQAGWKIMFVPNAPVTHYLGVCGRATPIFVEWHKHKGMIRFYRKFFQHQYPGALMWLVKLGVWMRFSAVVLIITVRRFLGQFRIEK
jgi:GT2 family glycosyltransferase